VGNWAAQLVIKLAYFTYCCSLAHDPIITTTLQVYGVAAVPEHNDPNYGHLVIIAEAGIKNTLQLYQDEGRSIPLHVTYEFWSRLAAAVHCIHRKRIIHQDLKPENILVTAVSSICYAFDSATEGASSLVDSYSLSYFFGNSVRPWVASEMWTGKIQPSSSGSSTLAANMIVCNVFVQINSYTSYNVFYIFVFLMHIESAC